MRRSPQGHAMGMRPAATGGWKFEKLLNHQVEKKKNHQPFTGELKLQEQLGQFRLSNSRFCSKSEHVCCSKVAVQMRYFFFFWSSFKTKKKIFYAGFLTNWYSLERKLKSFSTARQDKNNTTWAGMEMRIRRSISWVISQSKRICHVVPWRRQLSKKPKYHTKNIHH